MRKNKIIAQSNDIKIMALDDDPTMTLTLQSYFSSLGYTVDMENDPARAIERIRQNPTYDILLLDFLMTPICGDKVVAGIREFNDDLFIILLTGHKSMAPPVKTIRELNIQGYFEKSERFDQLELLVESCVKSIQQMRTIRAYRDELEEKNEQLSDANELLRDNYTDIINALRSTVDARDIYTRGHSDRVALLSERIAESLGKSEEEIEQLRLAALFHDIGKIKIPDSILLKDSRLTESEYAEMKRHPEYARDILSSASMFKSILPAVLGHHERYDGKGYPDGLAGEAIPENARIICVADSFDAMTSFRRYRNNMSLETARSEIIKGRSTQFDPRIADVFLDILDDFDSVMNDPNWIYPNLEN
ncbi:MAG TPA: HD domain-containing protein [Bacillota bacterium]|nr:HD domain-containing protein [Bacillota bacterium]